MKKTIIMIITLCMLLSLCACSQKESDVVFVPPQVETAAPADISAPPVTAVPEPSAAPTPAATPAPLPIPEPTKTPVPIPEPTVPVGTAGNITVTKNPTGEALTIGGKTWFIAHASNADSLVWQLLDPDGRVYSVSDAMNANPGLVLEVLEGDTIAVSNVPLSLNGWSVQAVFSNSSFSAATSPAEIYVGDYTAAYASVIGRYKSAYEGGIRNEGDAERYGVSEMSAYSSHVGYAMKDLDKDGTPEIIIAAAGEGNNAGNIIFEIATLYNGSVKSLCVSRARDRFYLRTDSCVYEQGSNGAAYSIYRILKLNAGALSPTEELRSDLDDQARAVWYRTVSGRESVIGESEAFGWIDSCEGLLYVPFLTTIV